jgi:DNA-binding transcriptional ArsR family regulator
MPRIPTRGDWRNLNSFDSFVPPNAFGPRFYFRSTANPLERLNISCAIRPVSVHFVIMRNSDAGHARGDLLRPLKALASPVRLEILRNLKDPVAEFPPQVDGDLLVDGVCADFIREKLGIAAATASRHLTLLSDAKLLIATRRKGWTFYRRNNQAIARLARQIKSEL